MKLRKLMAGSLAATMVIGSGTTAFAADGATGTGTSFEHMDTEITSVTLPTDDAVNGTFNYYVDPERAVNSANKLADGTAVTANDDGVYFKVADGTAAEEGTDASVTGYSIGGVTSGLTVSVPDDTKSSTLKYMTISEDTMDADGWYDEADPADPVLVSGVTVSGEVTVTPVTGNTITVTPAVSGTSDAAVASYSIAGAASGLKVTIPADLAVTTLTYMTAAMDSVAADGWYAATANPDNPSLVSGVSVKKDAAPASGDTITITPATDGTPATGGTYASSSKAVAFSGMNSVDVDVSVSAAVTASTGEKDIALVEDEAALEAATTPALLMQLRVGPDPDAASGASEDDSTTESTADVKAITSSGATAKAMIAGKPDNFKADTENGKFVYKVRTDTDTDNGGTALDPWGSTTVQLIGKTNEAQIPDGANSMTAPTIDLTWTIGKHEVQTTPTYTDETGYGSWSDGTLSLAAAEDTNFSSETLAVEISADGETYDTLASDKYTVTGEYKVTTTWANIIAALDDETLTTAYIRITDGTTRYTIEVEAEPEPVPEATPASAVTGSGESDILIRLVSGVRADVAKITSVTVNGTAVDAADIAVSGSGNVWLKGVAPAAGTYEILINYDGTLYSTSYVK